MAPRPELVVTLDGRVHAGDEPLVPADDALFLRGDGVFETLLVRGGVPCLLDAHVRRLGESAALTGLPTPDAARWRRAVGIAVAQWGAVDEGVLRMVHAAASAFVTVSALPERIAAVRRDGVAAVTLTRRTADVPWSPLRAKSSSYAVNSAALREAARLGAGDAVFVDDRGTVLEGPRSAVVLVVDGGLVTPSTALPILPGTTVDALFATADERGVRCERATVRVADLLAAQSVWLLSAVTLAARVHTLDGDALPAGAPGVDVSGLVDAAMAGHPLG
jgi:4-amino-4-deoxychorismate lyase